MARTIFGIFNKIMLAKQEDAKQIGYPFNPAISNEGLMELAKIYHVSLPCILLAYKLWKQEKFSVRVIYEVSAKATKLTPKDKVFLYNSLVAPSDMAFENIPYNWEVCFGKRAYLIAEDSADLGVFDVSDMYFFADKDFGMLSFNEIRNVELAGAIEMWLYEQTQGGKRGTN